MVPEYVAGAVAAGGYLPRARGWSVLAADMQRMPILLLRESQAPSELRGRMDRSAAELSGRNASVSIEETGDLQRDISAASLALKAWFKACLPAYSGGR
jgi:hypothetical protein